MLTHSINILKIIIWLKIFMKIKTKILNLILTYIKNNICLMFKNKNKKLFCTKISWYYTMDLREKQSENLQNWSLFCKIIRKSFNALNWLKMVNIYLSIFEIFICTNLKSFIADQSFDRDLLCISRNLNMILLP